MPGTDPVIAADILIVFAILAAAIVLFVTDRVRLDVVAILVVLALMLSQVLTPAEALAGFGDPVVILIAGLFVVGEGLFRTGIAHAVGAWMVRLAQGNELRLLVLMMVVVAGLSAVMSSTGAVAVFIPIVLGVAARTGIQSRRLLMPLAFASLIGGMLTLIGTPPNLIANAELNRAGLTPFGFFSFTPIGLVVLVVGIAYVALIGGRLLGRGDPAESRPAVPSSSIRDLLEAHDLLSEIVKLRVPASSPLAGRTVGETLLRTRYRVTVVGVPDRRRSAGLVPALRETVLEPGSEMLVAGGPDAITALMAAEGLEPAPFTASEVGAAKRELGVVEVMVAHQSRLIGRTIKDIAFRSRYGVTVLAVSRRGERLRGQVNEVTLEFGDSLVLAGGWDRIGALRRIPEDLLVLWLPAEFGEVAPARARAPHALAVGAGMIGLLMFGLLPSVTVVLLAALAMVVTRCVSMTEAYRAMNWQSLVLIAGMLPMATALEVSGGLALVVDGLTTLTAGAGPMVVMAALFLLTSLLSQVISNTATTVLIAPVALAAAQAIGVQPFPLLMAVAIAASTAFSTPVASPVNTLVLGPGGYSFLDFVKVGLPLQALAMLVTLILVPLVLPL